MNKMLMIPIGIMLILTVITITWNGVTMGSYTTPSFNPDGSINIDGTDSSINVPGAGSQTFNLFGLEGAMVVLIAAIAVGVIVGIQIMGSGLSDTAQDMIFFGMLYFGLWGCLSIVTGSLIFGQGILFSFLWLILTIMLVIGFGQEMAGGSDA